MTAAVLALGFGQVTAGYVLLGLVIVAATLESVFAFCIGCTIFAGLIRVGLVPETVCGEGNNIWLRTPARQAGA